MYSFEQRICRSYEINVSTKFEGHRGVDILNVYCFFKKRSNWLWGPGSDLIILWSQVWNLINMMVIWITQFCYRNSLIIWFLLPSVNHSHTWTMDYSYWSVAPGMNKFVKYCRCMFFVVHGRVTNYMAITRRFMSICLTPPLMQSSKLNSKHKTKISFFWGE